VISTISEAFGGGFLIERKEKESERSGAVIGIRYRKALGE